MAGITMGGDKVGFGKVEQPEKHTQGASEAHSRIKPEENRKQLEHDKKQTASDHDKLINENALPKVDIVDSKPEKRGFIGGLIDGAKQGLDNLNKQVNHLVDGAETAVDQGLQKLGVPDDVRRKADAAVHDVVGAIKDPEKAAGQVLDKAEQSLDEGLKAAGVSDDIRKGIDNTIHTIRRIDEAELKLAKGAIHGAQKMVGGALEGTINTSAEILDKASEKIVANHNIPTGGEIVVAAAEVLGKKVVDTLGAAEKLGEKLKTESDKQGGLDKLVVNEANKLAQSTGKWLSETNIDNIGEKAEQVGEKLPDAALLVAGGMGLAKAAGETAEALNAIRAGEKLTETTEALSATGGLAESGGTLQESSNAIKTVETISNGSDKYTLLSNGEAVMETAAGESKSYTYLTRNDGETIILSPKNATPKEALEHSIVIDKDTGIVNEGLVKPGKGMYRDPESFEQALSDLPPGSKFVGKGQDRIAFESPDGDVYVLGPIQQRPPCPVLIQPLETELRPPYIQVERFEKLDVTKIEQHHIDLAKERARLDGWQILDDHPANFGLDKHGNVFAIDPEGIVPIEVK